VRKLSALSSQLSVKAGNLEPKDCVSIIDNPLGVQLLQKYFHLGAYLTFRREHKLGFELLHNLVKRKMALAEFENDAPRSLDANGTFGK